MIVNRYITITKLIDLFLNKVLRRFKAPKKIIFNYNNIFTSEF